MMHLRQVDDVVSPTGVKVLLPFKSMMSSDEEEESFDEDEDVHIDFEQVC